MIEVHQDPENAKSDGAQSLFPDQFVELMTQVRGIATVIGKKMA
jgi:3-deoxy-7-phosphoheptulonate synthase